MVLPIVIEYRGGTPTGNAVRFVAILYWSRIQVKDLAVVARPRSITFALPSSTWANTVQFAIEVNLAGVGFNRVCYRPGDYRKEQDGE